MNPLFLPSPPISGFSLGPLHIKFYALCIIAGILFAWWLSAKRWKARGGKPETLETIILWAIPFGIVGARIYHVATHIDDYFGPGRDPITVLYIWEGGIGIIGAISLGAVGAWIAARRENVSIATVADVLAPGIIFAQAIGRLGNYFNQELFGVPTTLPWALQIDPIYRPPGFEQFSTFHPMFLYEMLWNIAVGLLLLWLDRRFKMGYGKLFFSYVSLYTLGRLGTESLRIDPAELIFGIRNHQFVTGILLIASVVILIWLFRNRPGREPQMDPTPSGTEKERASDIDPTTDDTDESTSRDTAADRTQDETPEDLSQPSEKP